MKKVAIYSRKSIFTGKGESIENQIEMCKDYYLKHYDNDIEFLIYEDEGFSGGNTKRPKFQEMLADIKAKKFNTLICYRLDRISRNVADFSSTLELLQNNNIDFISIKEQFDTSSPMGRAMVYISSVFAQLERETIAERVRDNMLQLAKTGRWLGGQEPFGFKAKRISYIDENFNERSLMVLSPIKEESELIEKIYLKYIELQSITQVVNWLQDNKYKGKNGGEWVTTQVQRILSSPLYVKSSTKTHSYIKSLGINVFGEANGNGYLTYNKTRKMVIDRDITEWIYATAKHPGIIDDDKWLMVQTILTKNKHKKVKRLGTGSSNSALLTGILKCSKCGSNMIIKQGHKSKKEEGKRYDYYVCSKKDNSRGKKCDNKNIRTDRLDNIVIGQVNAYNKETLYSNLSKLLEESKDDTNINNKLSSIKLEIKENETKISNLIKQLSSAPNEIVSGYIMQEVSKLSAEINKLKSELENIKEDKKTYNYDLENLKLIVKMLKEFEENFEITDDITKKRLMIQTILNDVTWNGETLEAKITMFGEDKKKL
ncbi:recombinase family protein [uncultured Clostridium sp.]|uniref:recombinase family protein n=2 Tax=uncultured Clostridium sp. TaxID=59620 RepID=UPI0026224F7E|nr:recombinase family protein [uncultured Clostridium sp.]